MDNLTIISRLLITFMLSFLFGLERQMSHKPVGFGTYIFVAVGSCALSLTALTISEENPFPLLSAIVTGIGFLGAGALIKTTDKIFGFTSAASIWGFAVFGLSIGVGDYLIGSILYSFVWIVIIFDKYLEKEGIGSYHRKLTIVTNRIVNEEEIRKLLSEIGITKTKLLEIDIKKDVKKNTLVYLVEGRISQIKRIPKQFNKYEWLEACKLN